MKFVEGPFAEKFEFWVDSKTDPAWIYVSLATRDNPVHPKVQDTLYVLYPKQAEKVLHSFFNIANQVVRAMEKAKTTRDYEILIISTITEGNRLWLQNNPGKVLPSKASQRR